MNETYPTSLSAPRQILLSGLVRVMPIALGYVPIGFAFGVLSVQGGISTLNTLLMSIFIYAGSAQLIGVGLLATGVAPLSIILTTFVVNLRHTLMAAALSPHLKNWRRWEQVAFAYELTDESFAIHAIETDILRNSPRDSLLLNFLAQCSWFLGTCLGAFASQMISDVRPLGLDYALPAMFIALLLLQIKNRSHVMVAILAGILSIVLSQVGLTQWHVIVATMVAATLGVVIEQWIKN